MLSGVRALAVCCTETFTVRIFQSRQIVVLVLFCECKNEMVAEKVTEMPKISVVSEGTN